MNEGMLELLVYKASREKDIFRRAALILNTIAAQHLFFNGNNEQLLQRQRTAEEMERMLH